MFTSMFRQLSKVAVIVGAVLPTAWAGIPIQHWTQASGTQIYLVESPAIPMLDVQIDFDAGDRRDPAAQAGLASLTAALTSKGVRADASQVALDENALNQAWADLGASFGGGAGNDRMSFSLRTLTYPDLLDRVVQLAARQLGQPSYAPEVLARERARIQASLREANTRPATQASRAFERAVYGDHPYGYELTEATLDRISTSDLQALHERTVWPCRAKVSLVGAINRAQADALVTQLFAKRAASPSAAACQVQPSVPEVAPLKAPLEVRVPFEAAQAQVLIGQPGFKRDDPDYFALTVGNYILGGGGFVSRLTEEVKTTKTALETAQAEVARLQGLEAGRLKEAEITAELKTAGIDATAVAAAPATKGLFGRLREQLLAAPDKTTRQAIIVRELARATGYLDWRSLGLACGMRGSGAVTQATVQHCISEIRRKFGPIIAGRNGKRGGGYRLTDHGRAQIGGKL